MGILDFLRKKSRPSLKEDIVKGYDWIALALRSSGYLADFSLASFKEIDRFFEEHSENGNPKTGGLLSQSTGMRLFAIGSYVGEVIRREFDGEWITDDNDPKGEMNIQVKLSNGTIIWPVQRVMKRMKNGSEDGMYAYGYSLKGI